MDQNSKLSFSQRKGLKPIKEALQVESMDGDLRNTLWTLLYEFYFSKCKRKDNNKDHELYELFQSLWRSHLKKPIDTLHDYFPVNVSVVKRYFFVLYGWNDVYDLLEFIVTNYDNDEVNKNFVFACNLYLEKELSAYRFVAGKIIQITSEDEAIEIEEALSHDFLRPVNIHLKTALGLLSNKQNLDFRNSIKESISAVEALSKLITKKRSASLGDALKEIEKNIEIHGALKSAFTKLYGYTSDAEGIRHSLMDKSDLNFEDAKFMLVACSTFINYLIQKSIKSGIEFS